MPRLPLGAQAYTSAAQDNLNLKLVNVYSENQPQEGRFNVVNVASGGLKLFATVGTGPIRGEINMNGTFIVVSGASVYEVASSGAATLLGGGITGSGLVSMAHNGTQTCIVVPGGNGYIATSSTLVQITDPDFMTAGSVTFIDGYFVFSEWNSGIFFLSAINDGLTYDALDFATAESDPDNLVRVFEDHQELWLFGPDSIEVWTNTGGTFPFTRLGGALLERGVRGQGAFSVQKMDNTVFWEGNDGGGYRADGFTPQRISTFSVDRGLAGGTLSSMAFEEGGHLFWAIDNETKTFVYDPSNNLWHERESWQRNGWRVWVSVSVFDKTLMGSKVDGKIYQLDKDTHEDDGDAHIRVVDLTPPHADQQMVFHRELEVIFEMGGGLVSGQGSDPLVMMIYSDNGGRNWSNEQWRSLGKTGEYRRRAVWKRQGRSRDRIYRITFSDPIPLKMIGAKVEAGIGS